MRKETARLLIVFLVTFAMLPACKRGSESDLSKLGPSSAATTTVLPVGSSHCPGGGLGIYTGNDANGNGILEASEVQKGSPVCDQLTDTGSPLGNTSLIMVVSEPTSTMHCLAGGLKVLSGADANKNGVLDANEIAFTDYLCNGTPGSSSAAGITVVVGSPAPVAPEGKKKGKKPEPAKKPAAGKPSGKAAAKPVKETKNAEAGTTAEGSEASAGQAAQPKQAAKKAPAASPEKEKKASAKPVAAPAGWTSVKVNSPNLATVAYKVEGRSIAVRFTNLSDTSAVRFKYTVRWKVNQNGKWVDDSSAEGLSFRLKPKESLDRDVRTQTKDVRDVVVELEVAEAS
jgi:hypothetical protein